MRTAAKETGSTVGFRWSRWKKQLLLVDDNRSIREVLAEHLKRQLPDISVNSACTGTEALEYVSTKPVDMLITEVDLPGMNGYDLIEKVREARPAMPIMVMTDDCSTKVVEMLTSLKVNGWLEKPFTKTAVVAAVRTELDRMSV